jgi:hypothetical protein
MSRRVQGIRVLLVAVALTASGALTCVDVAVAQQPSQTPTELWEEYPLAPEQDPSQQGADAPRPRTSRDDAAPAVVNDSDAVDTDEEEPFPLLEVILALGLLLLVGAFGMGALAREGRVAERPRERFGTAWEMLSRYARPVPVLRGPPDPRWSRTDSLTPFTRVRPDSSPSAADTANDPETTETPTKPPKPKPPKPKPRQAWPKKPPTRKPPIADLPRPPRPACADKPAGAAKPAPVKPAGEVKQPKRARPAKPKSPPARKPASEPQPPKRERVPDPPSQLRLVPEQPPPGGRDARAVGKLTCSIFVWRNEWVASFYAFATGLQGHEWIVERSPRFEWPAGGTPPEAYEAHAILVAALLRAGWRSVGTEGAWYRQCFERSVERRSNG